MPDAVLSPWPLLPSTATRSVENTGKQIEYINDPFCLMGDDRRSNFVGSSGTELD